MGRLMGLFPPGKGGGEAVAYGYKGKGILIHTIAFSNGMPLANKTTAANGSEREQVLPLLDGIKIQTGKPGRPRRKFSVLAAERARSRSVPLLCKGQMLRIVVMTATKSDRN